MTNKIILTDDQLISYLIDWIKDSDMDDLATTAGFIFGGVCNVIPKDEDDPGSSMVYEFIPKDGYYTGAFDNIKENE